MNRNFPYFDPGDTGGSLASSGMAGQQYDAPTESNRDPANWANNAGQAWLKYRFQDDDPDPLRGVTNLSDFLQQQNSPEYQDWQRRHIMDMIPGTGAFAGPVRAIKEPIQGGLRTVLQYYKNANPAKTLGELTYSKASGGAPLFENIVSGTPRGTGELLEGLQKRLGPMLDDMQLTSIQPQAASFWQKLARSSRLDKYPNLRNRILGNVEETAQRGQVTPNSYNYNPYKYMGYFD
jgi:hypothetical protein